MGNTQENLDTNHNMSVDVCKNINLAIAQVKAAKLTSTYVTISTMKVPEIVFTILLVLTAENGVRPV